MSIDNPPREPESAHESERESINWDSMLRHSFLFSQGSPGLQNQIFEYLAAGPLKGAAATPEDFKSLMISKGTINLAEQGMHTAQTSLSTGEEHMEESANRKLFTDKLKYQELISNTPEHREQRIRHLAHSLIERDKEMLERRGQLLADDTDRDVHSSFVIDYGLLRNGTRPWAWKTIPEPYKKMWQDVTEYMKSDPSATAEAMTEIGTQYLQHHPDLPEADANWIRQFMKAEQKSAE